MALRRLKPMLGAFEYIDAAIEVADAAPGGRDAFRSARERIIEMICDVAEDDEGGGEKAEALCALLDEAMAGSLATLKEVPAEKIKLEAGYLVRAVGALMREHPSEQIRGLAADVAREWRAAVTAEVDRARARGAVVLEGILATPPPPPLDGAALAAGSFTKLKKKAPEEQPRPRKITVGSSNRLVRTAETYAPLSKTRSDPIVSSSHEKPSVNMGGGPAAVAAQTKKTPVPVVASSVSKEEEEEKMEATKRKLHERYQEAEDAKRRRTIQVIKPPRPPPPGTTGQRKGNANPGMRARAPASCAAERILAKSCSLRRRV